MPSGPRLRLHCLGALGLGLLGGLAAAGTARAQSFTSELISTSLVENGRPVRLELVVYQPPGPGPFPTVMFNHGSTGTGTAPAEFARTWHNPAVAGFFTSRGWMVVFPQRRGRGRSDGLYDEGFAPDRAAGYTCDPVRSLAGMERALADLDEVVRHLDSRPEVDRHRRLIAGQSRGGILSVVYAGSRPGAFRGAINFVGGWMSDSCPNPAAINTTAFVRGAGFPGPTLWLYGENDPFYSLAHSRANHAAFLAAGGRGEFTVFALGPGRSGHDVFLFPELWGPSVDTLLRELPPPASGSASAAFLTNLALRARLASGTVIVGFVVGGGSPRRLLVRGIGPGLRSFGLEDAATDTSLVLYSSDGLLLATYSAWQGDPELAAAFAAAGAFPLDPAAADVAAVAELGPGAYSLHLGGGAPDRIVLGELFALGTGAAAGGLANLSARVVAGQGEATAIGGFTVGGREPAMLLVRAAGPALAAFGLTDAARDPQLAVYDFARRLVAANDDWSDSAVAAAAGAAGAFPFLPGSRDAAALLRLSPGSYSLHVTADSPGTVLFELYALAAP